MADELKSMKLFNKEAICCKCGSTEIQAIWYDKEE